MLKNNSHHIFTQTNLQTLKNPINCDLLLANCSYASISKQKNVLSQTVFRVNRSKGLVGGARKTTFVPTCHHEVACSGLSCRLTREFSGGKPQDCSNSNVGFLFFHYPLELAERKQWRSNGL